MSNKSKPLVSIVTPSYNQGIFIKETIDSIKNQDYTNIEHIVIDGGSNDETVDILKSYGEELQWVSEKDNGQTDAINKGLRLAKGDIVAYLNSDDLYLPGTISYIVEMFEKRPDTEFLYGDFHAIDAESKIIDKIKTIPFDHNILLYDANFISQPASFYRRSLIDKIGFFDDKLIYLMDYEFFLRAAKRKVNIELVKRYLSAIRYHGNCKTLTGSEPWAEERTMLKDLYARHHTKYRGAKKILKIIYRSKRYISLILRGRLDFTNRKLAIRRNQISG